MATRRAGPVVRPGPRGARFVLYSVAVLLLAVLLLAVLLLAVLLLAGHRGHCTTDHTKVAVPETPSVSVAVTVTV
jgi:hypothetical protein